MESNKTNEQIKQKQTHEEKLVVPEGKVVGGMGEKAKDERATSFPT